MSTTGITSSMFSELQQFQQEFQRLGQDLQSGNVSAAQSDFATLEKRPAPNQFHINVRKQQPDCPSLQSTFARFASGQSHRGAE